MFIHVDLPPVARGLETVGRLQRGRGKGSAEESDRRKRDAKNAFVPSDFFLICVRPMKPW
jgi:hypothetical protein